jgi:peptidoglycan hydrolase-like protein with peptidoglycan-binding domain/L,D-peptidoglycan transpeptidase YkuD (ErfK/YbiS/YcfS/YnhG family)
MPPRAIRRFAALAIASVTFAGGSFVGDGSPRVEAACSISTALRLGSTGGQVQCLQSTLNAQRFNSGPVDGQFGPVTYRATVGYQRAKGLFVDGIVGPQTGGSLGIWRSAAGGATPSEPSGVSGGGSTSGSGGGAAASCTIASSLRIGSTGDGVRCLQSRLTALGYPVGPTDGLFGSMTYGGVVRYQQAKGLFVDGIVGPQTGGSLGIWGSAASGGGSPAPSTGSSQCAPPSGVPAGARQVVVVNSSGSRADVDLLVSSGGGWTCARSDMSGRVGRNGVRTLAQRRSGDGTTPGGIFPLASMTAPDGQTFQFFGNGVNPGVHGSWRQVRAGDCWGATPNTPDYNRLAGRTAANCQSPDEYLVNFQQSYSRAALIGANVGPDRSGDDPDEPPLAAAIFLHRHSFDGGGNSRPTSGCVSLGNDDLIYVLQRLVPGEAWFVIR